MAMLCSEIANPKKTQRIHKVLNKAKICWMLDSKYAKKDGRYYNTRLFTFQDVLYSKDNSTDSHNVQCTLSENIP